MKGTIEYGITYVRQKSDLSVIGYVDADYARDLDNRRSKTDYMFTLAGEPICLRSIIQSTGAMSTTKAEYMVATEIAKEALWLTGLVRELNWSSIIL